MSPLSAPPLRQRLAGAFRRQARFAQGYAPLYECLFATVAGWLSGEDPADEPLVDWLTSAAAGRSPFATTNLLLAGLHRELLRENPAAAPLRPYYPTLGGSFSAAAAPVVARELRAVVWACRRQLAPFIAVATVQTNETSRGLTWRLPLAALPWPAVHLVDLGASGGLNLLADLRVYDLVAGSGAPIARLGAATAAAQFTTACRGRTEGLGRLARRPLPRLLSRTGVDVAPFALDNDEDARTLMAYVWADQPQRLARLREGIDLLRALPPGQPAPALRAVRLPEELDAFLAALPASWGRAAPVVFFNSYMTPYLPEKGYSLRRRISRWAQGRQVAWFQLEPRSGAPEFGWCSWSVDLWLGDSYRAVRLGWTHPHLTHAYFTAGLDYWLRIGSALSP